jgi:carbon storage regulator
MLVLTRRAGESIVIGNGIKITVVNIGPGRVKIGVEAPPSVRVDRAEIHARILNEQASDVFVAVSAQTDVKAGDHPTLVNGSADTKVLPNRVAEQLPDLPEPDAVPAPGSVTTPVGSSSGARLSSFRAPRKSR